MPKPKTWKVPLLTRDATRKVPFRLPNGRPDWDVPQDFWADELVATKGSLCHYAREHAKTSYDWPQAPIEWLPAPYEFDATMYLDSLHSGRSAKYVTWKTDDGRIFPMFIAEVVKLLKLGGIQPGGRLTGHFTVVKRGQNYGIEAVSTDA